jgi:hypothetical protein
MPLWGGFDGFDITKPDPLYNAGWLTATELTNYAYNTYKRAIDTVADPEFIRHEPAWLPRSNQGRTNNPHD